MLEPFITTIWCLESLSDIYSSPGPALDSRHKFEDDNHSHQGKQFLEGFFPLLQCSVHLSRKQAECMQCELQDWILPMCVSSDAQFLSHCVRGKIHLSHLGHSAGTAGMAALVFVFWCRLLSINLDYNNWFYDNSQNSQAGLLRLHWDAYGITWCVYVTLHCAMRPSLNLL